MAAAVRCFRASVLRDGLGHFRQLNKNKYIHGTSFRLFSMLEEFNQAKEKVSSLKNDPGNEVKLQMYALFKQGSIGKCTTKKPGAFDFINRAKWTAWNNLGDISQEEAQKQYISMVNDLLAAEGQGGETKETTTVSSDSEFQEIVVKKEDGIYTIQLNRPHKKNAITVKMYNEWIKALELSAQDDSVVTMVTGAGDYYSSGNDLTNFTNMPEGGPAQMAAEGKEILRKFVKSFIDYPKPLISAVNGPAVGVPVTVLGLFDLVYATDKATFHTPFSALGQSPEGCSSYIFPKIMGNAQANEVLLGGRMLTANEAHQRGLVTDVFPHDDFWREVNARVKNMAQLPPKSLMLSKKLIRDTERAKLHEVNDAECELLAERWLSDECMQAVMKFLSRKQK